MSIRIGLRYEGNGYFKAFSRHALEEAQKSFEQGEALNAELRRPRSVSQNNLFHALCEAAFDKQRDGPQFISWRHLRNWLLIRVGECTEERFGPNALTPQVAAALRRRFDFVEFSQDTKTGEIVMRFANSISFDKMDSDRFTKALDRCLDIISSEIVPGVEREQLMAMSKRGAA